MEKMLAHTLTGRCGCGPVTGLLDGNPTEVMPTRPIIIDNPLAIPEVLPAGTSVSAVELEPTWIDGALDADHLKKYAQVGTALQKYGLVKNFDFGGMLGAISAGAVVGGPIGAAIGALLFGLGQLFKGGGVAEEWAGSGPGVHAYASALMPEAFAGGNGWCRTNAPGAFASVDLMQKAFLAWTIQDWQVPLTPAYRDWAGIANSTYFLPIDWAQYDQNAMPESSREAVRSTPGQAMPAWVAEAYAEFGIDFEASIVGRDENRVRGFAMKNLGMELKRSSDSDGDGSGGGGALLALAAVAALAMKR